MLYIVHSYYMKNSVRAAEWASQGFLTVASREQRVAVLSLDFPGWTVIARRHQYFAWKDQDSRIMIGQTEIESIHKDSSSNRERSCSSLRYMKGTQSVCTVREVPQNVAMCKRWLCITNCSSSGRYISFSCHWHCSWYWFLPVWSAPRHWYEVISAPPVQKMLNPHFLKALASSLEQTNLDSRTNRGIKYSKSSQS